VRTIVFATACLMILSVRSGSRALAQTGAQNGEWRTYGGDLGHTKYSPLDQITRDNVKNLRIAWRWLSIDEPLKARIDLPNTLRGPMYLNEATPLMVHGVLYTSTAFSQIAAIDARTGKTLWSYDPVLYTDVRPPEHGFLTRGLSYWTDGKEERLLYAGGLAYLLSIDAKTGKPDPNFGNNGRVDLREGLGRPFNSRIYSVNSPPVICRDVVIVGSTMPENVSAKDMPPGHIRGYDVRTGKMKWVFHTIAQPGEFGDKTWEKDSWAHTGGVNIWTNISADEELGYVYLPVGTPMNDFYGGERLGDNLFADSLVCIEARTGKRVWHFQLVHHPIWDYDPPGAPNLINLKIGGRTVRAVAQITKQGYIFVFDRVTGKPVWPIEERPVPQSSLPGERSAATQPFLSQMARACPRTDLPSTPARERRLMSAIVMLRDDWEIFVATRDGKDEQRVTREIQHDILPRFVGSDRLLGLIGEPRHRRSYLYDLRTLTRTRVFHNNTVRTIAPEYQWAASPDGTKLLIGAERDGNTVSPDRGVYLVDLEQKVTKADVLSRLRANLKSEMALKIAGSTAFQPIAADIRRVVTDASAARVFDYEKALFDFESKNLTQPGNRKASECLFNTCASFGYAPEYQWFERPNAFGGRTANVVATLRGTENPDLVYVVSSHFDSVEAGPGADDDSSGTAALLEAARVLASHPMPATIVFASMTGEEGGLLGSREFARRAVESKTHFVGVLNNDMIGWMNDQRMDNTIRYSNPGIRDIQHAAAFLFTKLITYDALYWKGTDAASFYDVYGDIVGGIGSYQVLGSPHYHQSTDLLEHENHQLITETSKTTVATLMLLASSPSRLTGLKVDSRTGQTATISWTPSPEKGVTSYIVASGPASDPLRRRVTVTEARATLDQIATGSVVSVKAVNARARRMGLGESDNRHSEVRIQRQDTLLARTS
jgi:outer membrane protein assembly factor BamB